MNATYLPYALLAMGAYALVSPLMRVATTGPDAVPSDVAVVISNVLLVTMAGGVLVYTGQGFTTHLGSPKVLHVLAAGVFLGIGILALYRSLALGPVSVVTPIFAMFLVFSSLIGVLVLGESFSARKALGIVFAIVAVYLVSGA
ncbi:EamA family transporter [Halorubrum sp. JWXQ-INN 858]|uniref:EamA family transporter n=1 Tax=Halorubrum sp. JWXQ-INN 858 TaxID=2690782 RepID=UPI0013579A8D|nr:EamA family transporter [Halorubrum sp. JWXQ-INN 858]MWV65155.1 EamA family transporter [Halorubrum sp. JWXQ-INN 858]